MEHPAVADLQARVRLALAHAGGLLLPAEAAVAERLLGLTGEPALLLARLAGRRATAWRVPELRAAGVEAPEAALEALGDLVDGGVPWDERARLARVDVLAAGCQRLGLPHKGRREALVERLLGAEGWDDAPWTRLGCAPLLLRLDRWATFELWPDPAKAVLERLGVMRWASYPTTAGALVPDRAAWDRWEALVEGWEALDDAAAIATIDELAWPPGGLDLRGALAARLLDRAAQHARGGDLAAAEAALRGLAAASSPERGEASVRLVRLLAGAGRTAEAAAEARVARGGLAPGEERALARAARRLGGWAPEEPGLAPRDRDLRLPGERTPQGPRFGGLAVEPAVVRLLQEHGRSAVISEGQLWRTILALLFAEVMFLPVEGQLPVPFLAGPLDWGTPRFAAQRAAAVADVWAEVDAGRAGAAVRAAWERWSGVRLRGARWELATPEQLAVICEALPPAALRALLAPLLDGGSRASRGLPDLVVLPGPAVKLPGAFPSALGEGLTLVELKTENDVVRDEQAAWFDRLLRAGVAVELWRVSGVGG